MDLGRNHTTPACHSKREGRKHDRAKEAHGGGSYLHGFAATVEEESAWCDARDFRGTSLFLNHCRSEALKRD